jgi:hypothetical protein
LVTKFALSLQLGDTLLVVHSRYVKAFNLHGKLGNLDLKRLDLLLKGANLFREILTTLTALLKVLLALGGLCFQTVAVLGLFVIRRGARSSCGT